MDIIHLDENLHINKKDSRITKLEYLDMKQLKRRVFRGYVRVDEKYAEYYKHFLKKKLYIWRLRGSGYGKCKISNNLCF